VEEKKTLELDVRKGWCHDTLVVYENAGDQSYGFPPCDIALQLVQLPHPRFERDGDNLIYNHEIDIVDALCGSSVSILTLDRRILSIPLTDIVTPTTEKIVPGEGMPIVGRRGVFGDLIVRFTLRFPEKLSPAQKRQIRNAVLRN
jgi:DnaJ-class molecular chaperone